MLDVYTFTNVIFLLEVHSSVVTAFDLQPVVSDTGVAITTLGYHLPGIYFYILLLCVFISKFSLL